MSDAIARARKDYYRARVENLRSQVPMVRILEDLGIRVHVNEDVEIQYPCPLHGDGQDNGFSARVYPGGSDDPGGHTFCWGCQKARDQIQWIRDYQGLSFIGAVKYIEESFGVSEIPNIYDYFDPGAVAEGEAPGGASKLEREIQQILDGPETEKFDVRYLERKIDRLVSDKRREISLPSVTRLYFVYDLLRYELEQGIVSEERAMETARKLEDKLNQMSV